MQEYLRFIKAQDKAGELMPRKMSQEYFKGESRKIEERMQRNKKRFTCFNRQLQAPLSDVFAAEEMVPRS